MKNLKKLFLLGSLFLLTGTAANAELVNGVRQLPEPATTAWTVSSEDTPYYLYNTSAKMFFTQGNTWGTRACVGPVLSAIPVYFSEAYEGVYYLNDYVNTRSYYDWRLVCAEADANQVYADQRVSWGRAEWNVIFTLGDGFRLQPVNPLYSTDSISTYFGRDDEVPQDFYNAYALFSDDNQRYPVSAEITEGEGHHIDWALVTVEDYEALAEVAVVYVKAQELLSYIESAKELGIDMTAERRIYEDEASAIEEMNVAIVGIQEKIKAAQAGGASVDNPADMTSSLVNPGFTNGKAGWNGTDPAFGEGAAEFYQKNYDIYQTLKDMPSGVYGISVQAFYRPSWAYVAYDEWLNKSEIAAKIYAKSGADSLNTAIYNPWAFAQTGDLYELWDYGGWLNSEGQDVEDENGYIPNNMRAASYLFSLDPENYKKTAYVAVDNGELTIGLKKNDNNPGGNWTMFDNFTLSYFGTAPEAYQMCLTKGMPEKAGYTTEEASWSYVNSYYNAYDMTATDKASLSAAVKAVSAANEAIAQNIQLWADLKAKYNQGLEVVTEYDALLTTAKLVNYLVDVEDVLSAVAKIDEYDLDNNQLEDMISTIDNLITDVIEEAKSGIQAGSDVTEYLTNPDFENGTNGWSIVSNGGGNVVLGGNNDNHCFEAWHSTNFDVYQEIANLPMGVYEVSVQGFVRYRDGYDAISYKDNVPENIPIYVYMNDSKTNLVNWLSYPKPASFYDEVIGARYLYDEEDENAYPDNMIAASAAFAEGGYTQTAKCLVAENGTITRIGVKGTPVAQYWPIFDNFKLTYLGYDVDVVKPLLEEKIAEAQQHQYDMTTKSAKQNLVNTIAEAEALLDGEDGLVMFKEIEKLNNAISTVEDYMYVCRDLAYTLEDFFAFADNSDSPLQDEAYQFAGTIWQELEASELEYWDIYEKKQEIREMEIKMQLPENYAQGSAEGVDVTAFIRTPNFSKYTYEGEVNSFTGWQTTNYGYNYGNDEYQRSAFALEYYAKSFDMYQEITGVGDIALPKGNYRLQVNAFERVSDDTPAYLYVETEEGIQKVELMKRADGFDEEEGEEGPNDMVSSVAWFEEGRYLNTINFRSEGDVIRIGIMHEDTYSTDWIIMDNFKLYFFGDNAVEEEHNSLYIADGLRLSTTKTNMLPISLKNEDEIVGFQFDVVLPQGMTLAKNARGRNLVSINSERTETHTLTANAVDDFTIRIVGASMENEVLSGVDGILLEMGIDIASWVPNGVYPIQLKDVKLTNSDRQTLYCSDKTFMVTVGGKLGDVNCDDEIDVTDVVLIIDDILMKNPSNYDASLADVNSDGYIDVTDVVMVIDAILGKIELSRGAELIDRSAYTAFQMDLTIPAGYVLESVTLTDIAKDSHSLAYNMLPDGRCRVVVCSMNNEALPGAWDEVISLNLRGKGDAQVNIDRAVFVTIDGERHELMMNPTSIAQISNLKSQISNLYDLQGRKVEKASKGILIENGKKIFK